MSEVDATKRYENQVRPLLDILPIVMADARFALKGWTAINLFVRDLPRFSIDIDLTYLPIETRDVTIREINTLLKVASQSIAKSIKGARVTPSRPFESGRELKLVVEVGHVMVKVEANYIHSSIRCDASKAYCGGPKQAPLEVGGCADKPKIRLWSRECLAAARQQAAPEDVPARPTI